MSTKSTETNEVTYRELFKFFLPLALNPMMIGSTHTIINAALARLPFPEASIAVFTVVKSFSNIVRAPILMSRQVVTSLIAEKKSYYLIRKYLWLVCGIIFLILFLMGFTPLGGWVLKNLIGLRGEKQIQFAYIALRITCLLPIVELLRNFHQGIAIGLRRTQLVIPGIILRLIVISIFLWLAVITNVMSGIMAGSIAWVIGIAIEALFIFGFINNHYQSPVCASREMPAEEKKLNFSIITRFFFPLGLMMMLTSLLQPLIQSGIARSFSPTRSLAAYGVAWSLVMILAGSLRMMNQCSLVYADGFKSPAWRTILIFCLLVGLALSLIIIILFISPAGVWILQDLIGVSAEVSRIARQAMLAFAIFPLLRAFKEAHWGILMKQQATTAIGVAKIINIMVVIIVLVLLLGVMMIRLIEPAVIGALAFTIGEGVESLVIRKYCMNRANK